MTVMIRAEIEVDVDVWRFEYGSAGDARDVEDYLLTHIAGSPAADAGGYKVTGFAVEEVMPAS